MSDVKYHYNSKTFQYERASFSVKDALWYATGVLFTALIFCGTAIVIHDSFVETDNERALSLENNLLKSHKPVLEEQLDAIDQELLKLKSADKNLYTRIFNAKPPEATAMSPTISREQALLADPSEFRTLLEVLNSKSELLTVKSSMSNAAFGSTIHITKEQVDLIRSIPSIQPLANPQMDLLVSGFGERINPFHKGNYEHPGVDFAAARGTEVYVTASGRVRNINRTALQAGYGNYIDVDHGHGFVTRYAHLEDIKIQRGQKVEKGTVIGTVGNSGGSIAPHLHYEVIRDGEAVDPARYLMEGLTSEQHNALLKLSSKQNQSLD